MSPEKFFDVFLMLLFSVLWLSIVVFLKRKKKKSLIYLFFFTFFYLYMYKVLEYTIFQFQSLIILKYFMPELMLRGQSSGENVQLLPVITLTLNDVSTSLLNIFLFIPFGFLLPLITDFRFKRTVIVGFFVSIAIEYLQFLTGVLTNISFRVADSNDLIFNTIGVVLGYLLFKGFVWFVKKLSLSKSLVVYPIFKYIAERPQK